MSAIKLRVVSILSDGCCDELHDMMIEPTGEALWIDQ